MSRTSARLPLMEERTSSGWLSPAEQQNWRSFVRVHQAVFARLVKDLQAHAKLSGADFEILVPLTDVPDGRMRFQDLAKTIEWEQSRLSHQISRMIKRGLVAREDCPEDGRAAFVAITPTGRQTIEAAAPHHVETVRRLVIDALTPEDFAALGRINTRILDHLDQTPP
jgi:DNA-binding MarR family transcriptional regulator